jgi:transcriptional regulator of acetoin/glycerol metabolism
MALNLKIPISFMSEEKFCLELKSRACSAVPIKDAGGNIMAILGIAANFPNADTEIFGMLLIAATAVENHMKMIHTMEEVRFFGSYYKTVLDSVSDGVLVIDKKRPADQRQ